jgi:hypothetical protein
MITFFGVYSRGATEGPANRPLLNRPFTDPLAEGTIPGSLRQVPLFAAMVHSFQNVVIIEKDGLEKTANYSYINPGIQSRLYLHKTLGEDTIFHSKKEATV